MWILLYQLLSSLVYFAVDRAKAVFIVQLFYVRSVDEVIFWAVVFNCVQHLCCALDAVFCNCDRFCIYQYL